MADQPALPLLALPSDDWTTWLGARVDTLLAETQVQVNGVGVGPTAALVAGGLPLNDQVTFPANAGDTVQLVVGGLALTLANGDNATINLDKVQ